MEDQCWGHSFLPNSNQFYSVSLNPNLLRDGAWPIYPAIFTSAKCWFSIADLHMILAKFPNLRCPSGFAVSRTSWPVNVLSFFLLFFTLLIPLHPSDLWCFMMHLRPILKSQLSTAINFSHNLRLFFWFCCSYRIRLCSAPCYFVQQDSSRFTVVVCNSCLSQFILFVCMCVHVAFPLGEHLFLSLYLFLHLQVMCNLSWKSCYFSFCGKIHHTRLISLQYCKHCDCLLFIP